MSEGIIETWSKEAQREAAILAELRVWLAKCYPLREASQAALLCRMLTK